VPPYGDMVIQSSASCFCLSVRPAPGHHTVYALVLASEDVQTLLTLSSARNSTYITCRLLVLILQPISGGSRCNSSKHECILLRWASSNQAPQEASGCLYRLQVMLIMLQTIAHRLRSGSRGCPLTQQVNSNSTLANLDAPSGQVLAPWNYAA
jgi:hypothetical protein